MGTGEFDHQRSPGRVKQATAQSGEETGEDQHGAAVGPGQRSEADGPQQHAGDDERAGAETVGERTAEDPQPLLGQLAQPESQPYQTGGPAELVDEAQADHRHYYKETQDHQCGIQRQKPASPKPRPIDHNALSFTDNFILERV